ncbi:MAG: cytochrome c peroxidase, partial [Candidatus Binatia bacterium]|nr:cytochrome c peroxidase [Candidatus Binatia bacterium]
GGRSAPTVINRVFSKAQFWDGRVPSLEEQAKGPITNPIEMGMPSHIMVVQKLNKNEGYRKWFRKVFGTDVTLDGIAKAISAFERTILSGNSPVDRYNYLGDEKALSASAIRGMKLFKEKGNCTMCHAGFNFTDEEFHNIGIGWDGSKLDLGLYAVTKKPEDMGKFKTPTIREISNTGPYMHDGRFAALRQVVDFYDQGGIANPFLDSQIKKLNLTNQEKDDIVAFLRSLSGEGWQHITPPDSFPE